MIKEIKRSIAKKYLAELLEEQDKEIYKDLAIAATVIAKSMMMSWLDMKGVHHCGECPSTEQLVRIGESYFCPQHAHEHVAKPLELVMP